MQSIAHIIPVYLPSGTMFRIWVDEDALDEVMASLVLEDDEE